MDRAPCEKAAGAGPGITGYIRSHLWVSIMGSLMLLFLLVVLIFQGYLKNAYYNYLLDETWKTESTVLSVASNSFDVCWNRRCRSAGRWQRIGSCIIM